MVIREMRVCTVAATIHSNELYFFWNFVLNQFFCADPKWRPNMPQKYKIHLRFGKLVLGKYITLVRLRSHISRWFQSLRQRRKKNLAGINKKWIPSMKRLSYGIIRSKFSESHSSKPTEHLKSFLSFFDILRCRIFSNNYILNGIVNKVCWLLHLN